MCPVYVNSIYLSVVCKITFLSFTTFLSSPPPLFFSGIGLSMCLISLNISLYYNIIMAYILYYFVANFLTELPWNTCKKVSGPKGTLVRDPASSDLQTAPVLSA